MDRIHIVGAGLGGLTLALALKKSGFKITLIEAASREALHNFANDTRTTALAYTSKVMMENLGIWQSISDEATPIDTMLVANDGGGAKMRFDPSGFCDHPMGYIAPNAALRRTLLAQVDISPEIELICSTQLNSIDKTPQGLRLNLQTHDARTGPDIGPNIGPDIGHDCSLLVGCDGRQSKVRELAGFSTFNRDYKQSAIVATLTLSRSHHNQAFQIFTKTGPIALLPLPSTGSDIGLGTDQRQASLIWSHDPNAADQLKNLEATVFLDLLNKHIADDFAAAVDVGPRQIFPLHAHYLANFVDANLALVGEAAHGVHPLAGQGFNLTVRDMASLSDVLQTAKHNGTNLGSKQVLETYQNQRAGDTSRMFGFTDQMTYMLSGKTRLPKFVRNLGFATIDQLSGLRDQLTKHAMGKMDDLPPLMRENWQQRFADVA